MKTSLYILPPCNWYAAVKNCSLLEFINEQPYSEHPLTKRLTFGDRLGKMDFSIPIVSADKKGAYRDLRISYQTNWHKQLMNALKTAYGNSPFFEYHDYKIEGILNSKPEKLYELNFQLMAWSIKALKWECQISNTDETIADELSISKTVKEYNQVFKNRNGFVADLSILDLIFNSGVDAGTFIENL